MTNEQREAIRQCELYVQAKATIQLVDEIDGKLAFKSCDTSAIDTVLSLIKEQQEEIEGLKDKEVLIKRYFNKCDLIKQKDKQIDLMARAFKQDDVRTVEEIKQYFAGLVEKE